MIKCVKKLYPECKIVIHCQWREEVMSSPETWMVPDGTQSLLIIDDCLSSLHKSQAFGAICRGRSHHDNISVMCLTQDLNSNGSEFKSALRNMHYIIVTSHASSELLQNLQRKLFPYCRGFLHHAFEGCRQCCSTSYPYMLIDQSTGCPKHMSVKTGIFKGESGYIFGPNI